MLVVYKSAFDEKWYVMEENIEKDFLMNNKVERGTRRVIEDFVIIEKGSHMEKSMFTRIEIPGSRYHRVGDSVLKEGFGIYERLDGDYRGVACVLDDKLMTPYREPQKIEKWLCVFFDEQEKEYEIEEYVYDTQELAEFAMEKYRCPERYIFVDTIKVEWQA